MKQCWVKYLQLKSQKSPYETIHNNQNITKFPFSFCLDLSFSVICKKLYNVAFQIKTNISENISTKSLAQNYNRVSTGFFQKFRLFTLTTTKNFSSSLDDLLCDGGDEPLEDVHAGRDAVVLHKRLPLLLKEYLNIFTRHWTLKCTLHFYAAMNTEMCSTLHFYAAMNTEMYSTLHFYAAMNTEMCSTLHFLHGNEHRAVQYTTFLRGNENWNVQYTTFFTRQWAQKCTVDYIFTRQWTLKSTLHYIFTRQWTHKCALHLL